jgi:hypothetical protein
MIVLSKISQAANSYIKFKELPETNLGTIDARVSRTATLDGGVVLDHMGFVEGDRTMQISTNLAETEAAALWAMAKTELLLGLACEDGYFTGAISSMVRKAGVISFTFLVKNKE